MNKILVAIFTLLFVPPALAQIVPQSAEQMQMSFAPLVKKTGPAVVNIYTKRVVRQQQRVVSPFFNDPFFSQFFNDRLFAGPMQEKVERALGSGVIVDGRGIVVTNNHVIRDADEITVVTSDGREFEAKKTLDDAKVDLAVLKIDTKGETLPQLELADSDLAQVGDLVLAIGDPFGVGQTVTSGIISGLARTSTGISDYGFFIQTDAAINPGNSGGALVDMQGKLVGINTAIFSTAGGSLGIGFAIPANMLKNVLAAAAHGGKLVHPWSGITTQNVTHDMIESLNLKRATGTLITKVAPNSPADKAGLRVGDIVLSINGKEIQDASALRFRLATVPIGTEVDLVVLRNGKERTTKMTTAAPPETTPRDTAKITGVNPLSGATVENISPAVMEEIGALAKDKGVVVTKVENGSAARLGLQAGDIVLAVNGDEIFSVSGLKSAIRMRSPTWQIQLMRGDRVMSLVISGG